MYLGILWHLYRLETTTATLTKYFISWIGGDEKYSISNKFKLLALIDIFKIMKSQFHFVFSESLWEWPYLALARLELIYIHLICLSENSGDRFLELHITIRSERTEMFSLEETYYYISTPVRCWQQTTVRLDHMLC